MLRELREHRVFKVQLDLEHKAFKVQLVLRELKEHKESKVLRD